ncbi:SRPBCC family protein [Sphingopyxis sp. GW247-27LB]|uniref:aromatic ring-hydroxylating oxygenase subunit alpha n=1 Tax=Sphingopyxis sp. GW247-27LB TaxID=2012632 RepID=UPI000BA57121|nr:aromatic ring-hydroxylating dioxygenase subunit alpha [Sphingopyxis sp. GW247-27LB]PAL24230.1 p-cumate dioxygenase [Sphingopyxis sp. GW247-27LB]
MATALVTARKSGRWIQDDRQAGLFKVSRDVFTSPEILELERALIFDRSWLFIGHGSELKEPNDYLTRKVGGRELIFNRDRGGEYRAFFNTCPHRGAMVAREKCGNALGFKCFYHGWSFNNNGKYATRTPAGVYPENFGKDGSLDLAAVPRLDSYRDFFFVNYDPNARPLVDFLQGAAEILDLVADHSPNGMEIVGGAQEYSIRANWKLLVENSFDGYHAAETHETYFAYLMKAIGEGEVTAALDDLENASRGLDLGGGHGMVEGRAPWGRPIGRAIPAWGEEGKAEIDAITKELVERVGPERAARIANRDRNLGIFPNLVMNDIMAITVRTFYPDAPDLMNVTSWALAPVGETREARKRRLDNFLEFLGPGGFATPDDVEALESAQRGYAASQFAPWNDISRGMLKDQPASDDEEQMRTFWREWNRRMEAGL